MEKNAYSPRIFRWFGQTIFDRLGSVFFLKSAKQTIPDDKHHTHVLIQVRNIRRVVHAMMRWANKYPAVPFRQMQMVLCMYNIAVQLGEKIGVEDVDGIETHHCQWQIEEHTV